MRFYEPLDDLLGPRKRRRRSRAAFGLLGALGIGLVVYWSFFANDRAAEARTDRILSLSAPDFTHVLSEADRAAVDARDEDVEERQGVRRLQPNQVEGTIRSNQTLFAAMRGEGVDRDSIHAVVSSLEGSFDFRRARPGDEWEARLDRDGRILRFRYDVSAEEIYEAVRRSDGTYDAGRLEVPTETVVSGLGGTVITSVYDAVGALGEDTALASRFIEVFRWDFDFSRDAQPGDTFRLIVEKIMLDGNLLRYGRVLAAEFEGHAGHLRAFAHVGEDGRVHYHTLDGEPLERRFLQAPLTYRRISSDFSRRRFHPVLQRYRPHLGVDYAADTGTPIWAVSNGRVTYADYRGANGNLVIIDHEDDYESIYAHLSRFADGLERGDEIRAGQVIGYVGSTGRSTGPHLHFGVRRDGDYIDPMSLSSERGSRLRGDELIAFQTQANRYARELDSIAIRQVDLASVPAGSEPHIDDLPNDFGILDDGHDGDIDATLPNDEDAGQDAGQDTE